MYIFRIRVSEGEEGRRERERDGAHFSRDSFSIEVEW